ncbi:hypothetical protein IW261DRAFT_1594999 [Armillaria novae-zelandiae]|uniref:C2H2-type domain-containing protein n=1 Tax=Armillaria novae-zelandiae TaxID=153914 RepID=A0AA39P2I5_9AGAR|nr:hypothetical protein IW261DRAFT_1594999 [Armillaria novae-zelandiae]
MTEIFTAEQRTARSMRRSRVEFLQYKDLGPWIIIVLSLSDQSPVVLVDYYARVSTLWPSWQVNLEGICKSLVLRDRDLFVRDSPDNHVGACSYLSPILITVTQRRPPKIKRQTKNVGKYLCDEDGCEETFTREHDVKRHKKTHLDGEALRKEQHPCPITETGCDARMLQLTNLRKHVQSQHPDVKHLVCFKCRPDFQLFPDSVALATHIQVGHRPSQTRTRERQPRRKTTKPLLQPPKTPIINPSHDASDISLQLPTGRFSLIPSPPPRKSRVKLPSFISIPMSALPNDESEPPRSPSHRRPEWYRAAQPQPPIEVQPDTPLPAPPRRCHRSTQKPPSVIHHRAQDAFGIERPRHLPSPAARSSSAGDRSGSSLGRFPLPPPPPPTTRFTTVAFESNRLPSPRISRAPSPTADIPSSSPRELRRGSPKKVDPDNNCRDTWVRA